MDKQQKKNKRNYITPHIVMFAVQSDNLMLLTSGNAGFIEQGNSTGDAKRWNNFFEEDEEDENFRN